MKKVKKITKKKLLKIEKRNIKEQFKEWTLAVKTRDENKCTICGKDEYLNAHHLLPREIKEFRFNLNNGITLCRFHHRFSLDNSPHRNPFIFIQWLEENKLPQLITLRAQYTEFKNGVKNESNRNS